jgi:hypothetical protein
VVRLVAEEAVVEVEDGNSEIYQVNLLYFISYLQLLMQFYKLNISF